VRVSSTSLTKEGASLLEEFEAEYNGTPQMRKRFQLLLAEDTEAEPKETEAAEPKDTETTNEEVIEETKPKRKRIKTVK
jgi:hypothetical protein